MLTPEMYDHSHQDLTTQSGDIRHPGRHRRLFERTHTHTLKEKLTQLLSLSHTHTAGEESKVRMNVKNYCRGGMHTPVQGERAQTLT